MGLGITINAAYEGSEDAFRASFREFMENETSPLPGALTAVHEFGTALRAELFLGENLYCSFDDADRVTLSAKTNGTGPGYHAYIVDLLERMKEPCSLSWNDDSVEDESGYWHNRDFGDLQTAMANWLGDLAEYLVEHFPHNDASGLALSMSTDRLPDNGPHYAAHPLGWREQDFFLNAEKNGPAYDECASYFIWWERRPDAGMFRKCALCLMWCECNWLPPVTDIEKALFTTIFLCLEKAWDDDSSLAYPVREWKEMARLSGSKEIMEELNRRFPGDAPETPEIGYLRNKVQRELGNGWRMVMPGALHETVDDEDPTVRIFWNERHTMRLSLYAVGGEDLTAASLLDTLTDGSPAEDFPMGDDSNVLARILHEPQKDDDGSAYFGSFFFAAVNTGHVLYMSAFYDEESDKNAIESMFATSNWQKEE